MGKPSMNMTSSPHGFGESIPRSCAAVLAAMGCYWGAMLLPLPLSLLTDGQLTIWAIVFLPGYLVTAGLLARTFWQLNDVVRITIWVSSILVEGTWLTAGLIIAALDRNGPLGLLAWWAAATGMSVCGFLTERQWIREEYSRHLGAARRRAIASAIQSIQPPRGA